MNRQQVKELLPIIQAFAEGKTIQFHCLEGLESNSWRDISEDKNITFSYHPTRYRIKSEYRPFKDAEECFEEMKKHKPFGWISISILYRFVLMLQLHFNMMKWNTMIIKD